MSSLENLPVKEIITASTPFLKALIDEVIVPKLADFKKKLVLGYQTGHVVSADHFTEYLIRTYNRLATVNTIAFSNRQLFLKDVYVPLSLRASHDKKDQFKIDRYPAQLMERSKKLLITDLAGMGKSTLMKRVFIDILENEDAIPIFIELRSLNKQNTLLAEIYNQLNTLKDNFSKDLLFELLETGQFVFILDGYDEITLIERKDVTTDIQSFISRVSKNKFIITSRPENSLNSFGDFKELSIQPMTKSEAYKLIENYGQSGEISTLLIDKLDSDEIYPHVKDFLVNPLLVTLLFTAFDFKRTIPFKKYIFYRQVFDAYFDDHDLTKGDFIHEKHSQLASDDFHRLLRYVGFAFMRVQQSHCTKDELLKLITEAKQYHGISVTDSAFFKDLITTVPLFVQDGNHLRWSHKSLQEYFAAQFIYLDAKDEQDKILYNIYDHSNFDKFGNILELFCDIDPKTFRNVIIYQHLKAFKQHNDKLFSEYQIPGYWDEDDLELLKHRKELTFLITPFVGISRVKNESEDMSMIEKALQEYHGFRKKSGQFLKSMPYQNEFIKYQFYLYKDQRILLNELLSARKVPGFARRILFDRDKCYFYESNPDKIKPTFYEITDDRKIFCNSGSYNIKHTNEFIKSAAKNMIVIDSGQALHLLAEIEADLSRDYRALSSF